MFFFTILFTCAGEETPAYKEEPTTSTFSVLEEKQETELTSGEETKADEVKPNTSTLNFSFLASGT